MLVTALEALKLLAQLRATLSTEDKATLDATYETIAAENDEGFARLDAKLEEASRK